MKAAIHPQFVEATVVCSCGNTFVSRSTKPNIRVEVCYKCHPFYTGTHRFIDTQGRVEQFKKAQEAAKVHREKYGATKKAKKERREENAPKTLRELLSEA